MAIVTRTNPVGIDLEIQKIQSTLFNGLTSRGWASYESYDRAYVNPKSGGTIPEIYTANNEYKEVLLDDTFTASSFFLVDPTRRENGGLLTQTISVIFQADVVKLFPAITHRADEEMHNDIIGSLQEWEGYLSSVITGVSGVYSALEIPDGYDNTVSKDDMSNYHVVKIDLEIPYGYCN